MFDAQAITKAEEYARLQKLLDRENSKRLPSQPQIEYLEKQMVRIEAEFQRADLSLDQYLP